MISITPDTGPEWMSTHGQISEPGTDEANRQVATFDGPEPLPVADLYRSLLQSLTSHLHPRGLALLSSHCRASCIADDVQQQECAKIAVDRHAGQTTHQQMERQLATRQMVDRQRAAEQPADRQRAAQKQAERQPDKSYAAPPALLVSAAEAAHDAHWPATDSSRRDTPERSQRLDGERILPGRVHHPHSLPAQTQKSGARATTPFKITGPVRAESPVVGAQLDTVQPPARATRNRLPIVSALTLKPRTADRSTDIYARASSLSDIPSGSGGEIPRARRVLPGIRPSARTELSKQQHIVTETPGTQGASERIALRTGVRQNTPQRTAAHNRSLGDETSLIGSQGDDTARPLGRIAHRATVARTQRPAPERAEARPGRQSIPERSDGGSAPRLSDAYSSGPQISGIALLLADSTTFLRQQQRVALAPGRPAGKALVLPGGNLDTERVLAGVSRKPAENPQYEANAQVMAAAASPSRRAGGASPLNANRSTSIYLDRRAFASSTARDQADRKPEQTAEILPPPATRESMSLSPRNHLRIALRQQFENPPYVDHAQTSARLASEHMSRPNSYRDADERDRNGRGPVDAWSPLSSSSPRPGPDKLASRTHSLAAAAATARQLHRDAPEREVLSDIQLERRIVSILINEARREGFEL